MLQANAPEFASPAAIVSGNDTPPSVESSRSMLDTPAASEADHVTECVEPIAQNSPPFGAVSDTVGGSKSSVTFAGAPADTGSEALSQLRSHTRVNVTVPGPELAAAPSAS